VKKPLYSEVLMSMMNVQGL